MKPLNINKKSCSEVSSNCIVWQGPELECIGLCKGDTVTDVIYKLATELCNLIESLAVENYDITCLDSTSCPPETFQELIKLIISYICNIEAQNGVDGTNGNYTEVEAFAPGENGCVNGGVAIRTFDGATETQISEYFICNPEDGAEGDQGPQGVRGDYVQVTSSSGCPDGGYDVILYSGADDTVISTSTICNGVQGPQGQDIDHVSFTVSTGTPDYVSAQPGETDTYTVWGDAGETINLGSFNVYNGQDGECECVSCQEPVLYFIGDETLEDVYTTLPEDCNIIIETITNDTLGVILDSAIEGKKYTVKNAHNSVYSIGVNSALDIDGSSLSFSLQPNQSATFILAGGQWRIINTNFDY